MLRVIIILLSAMLSALTALADSADEKRIALVIGNEAYPPEVGALTYPHEDADTMAGALRDIGFDLVGGGVVQDADQAAMSRAILDFTRALRDAGPEAVGFFYYSGHGASTSISGRRRNYLIPSGAPLQNADELAFGGVDLSGVIDTLSTVGAKAVFVVSDACRDDLLWTSSTKGGAERDKGFAVERDRTGLFIVHATADGETAPDDGLFAQALASKLASPGVFADRAFLLAFREVARQRPIYRVPTIAGTLRKDICFVSCPGEAVETDVMRADRLAWERARAGATLDAAQTYLNDYPDGRFAPEARAMLNAFGAADLDDIMRSAEAAFRTNDYAAALTYASKACDLGSHHACSNVATLYEYGSGVDEDKPRARLMYEDACDGGYVQACFYLGAMLIEGAGGMADRSRGEAVLASACADGSGRACAELGDLLTREERSVDEQARGASLLIEQCGADDAQACAYLGSVFFNGAGVATDLARARSLAERSCNLGSSLGCHGYGVLLRNPGAGPIDEAEAAEAQEYACEAGFMDACMDLGFHYERGLGVEANIKKVADAHRKACDADIAVSCRQLGGINLLGFGESASPGDAMRRLRKACDLRDWQACAFAGSTLYHGQYGIAQDQQAGSLLSAIACENDFQQACVQLAQAVLDGVATSTTPGRMRDLTMQACNAGNGYGCAVHGELLFRGVDGEIDKSGAARAFVKGCEYSAEAENQVPDFSACIGAGNVHLNGDGVRRSRKKAEAYFERVCALTSGYTCTATGAWPTSEGVFWPSTR